MNRAYTLRQAVLFSYLSAPMDGDAFARLAEAVCDRAWGWQARTANLLGVDSRTVRRWITGERPVASSAATALRALALLREAQTEGWRWSRDGAWRAQTQDQPETDGKI